MTTTIHVEDRAAVLRALELLVSKRVARRLFEEADGRAERLLDIARTRGGPAHARLLAAQELHERALLERAAAGPVMSAPGQVRVYLERTLAIRPYEVFCILYLDNRHRLLAMQELFRGTIDGASVHPREVVREALAKNAAAVLLAHNHPSGVAEPSQADELITRRLREALSLVEIRVLDHFVVGCGVCRSLAEQGLL
jgi:DNA repair protein RadC